MNVAHLSCQKAMLPRQLTASIANKEVDVGDQVDLVPVGRDLERAALNTNTPRHQLEDHPEMWLITCQLLIIVAALAKSQFGDASKLMTVHYINKKTIIPRC